MKNLFLYTFILFLNFTSISAQNNGQLVDTVLYITPADEAFMIDKETKSLFKFSPVARSLVSFFQLRDFKIAYEQKLSPSFSITPFLDINMSSNDITDFNLVDLGAELRYYYQMKNLIKEGKQANNLSGKYFSFKYSSSIYTADGGYMKQGVALAYGIQKRFLNFGFLDYKLELRRNNFDFSSNSSLNDLNAYSLSTAVNVGIGIGKKYNVSDDVKCPIFKCYTNRKSALKINLNNTSGINFFDNPGSRHTWSVFLRPNIIYELKIGNSPVSVENDFDLFFSIGNSGPNFDFYTNYSIGERLGLKYYVNQSKHIKNGKSGNNLSGQYIFGRAQYTHSKYRTLIESNVEPNILIFEDRKEWRSAIQFGYGIQKEVLEKLFFDINLGFSKKISSNIIYNNDDKISIISDIKVGLMF